MFATLQKYVRRFRGAGWAFGDQAVVSACNFITMLVLARYMNVSAFGIFVLAHTGLRLATSFQNTGITEPHNSLGAKLTGLEYRRFTSFMGLVQIGFAFGWFGLMAAVGGILEIADLPRQAFAAIFLGGMLVPWMGQEFVRRVLYTKQDSRGAFVNDFVSYGAQAAGIVVFVHFYREPSVMHALMSYGLSSLLATVVGIWQIRGHLEWDRSVLSRTYVSETSARVWGFAKWLTGGNIVKWFGDNGHSWVMGLILGATPLGMFRAAAQIANALNPFQQAVSAYLPSVASSIMDREGKEGLRRLLRKNMIRLALPFAVICAAVMLLSRPLLQLAYGDKFLNQGLEWVIAVVALTYFLSFVKGLQRIVFMALEQSQPLFISSLMSAFLLATSGVALIYFFGIVGAPLSNLIQLVVSIIYFWFVYRRLMQDDPVERPEPHVVPVPVEAAN